MASVSVRFLTHRSRRSDDSTRHRGTQGDMGRPGCRCQVPGAHTVGRRLGQVCRGKLKACAVSTAATAAIIIKELELNKSTKDMC